MYTDLHFTRNIIHTLSFIKEIHYFVVDNTSTIMPEELLPIVPSAKGEEYPEIYNNYIHKKVQHLLLDGTYLNPLDSKLV